MQVLRFAQYTKRPWKNGLGSVWLIAQHPADKANPTWSVSLPEIDRDCPFSAYPGNDRQLLLLDGPGVDLHCRSTVEHVDFTHRLESALTPFAFRGEWEVACHLLAEPARVLSVIAERDSVSAIVTPTTLVSTVVVEKRTDEALVLFVASGTVRVLSQGQTTLQPLGRFDSIVALDRHYGSFSLSPQGFARANVVVVRVSALS